MSFEVTTRVFEGPLDLLLQLITSHQVDITELSLSRLVAEYLEHLDAMRDLDLEVTSEFLLIAATLIQLKARHLLPGATDIDLDDELALQEERDRLLARLLACLTFKDVGAVLAHRMAAAAAYTPRMAELDPGVRPALPDLDLGVDATGLAVVAHRALTRAPEEPELDHLDMDLPSVNDALADLRHRLESDAVGDFDTLVAACERPDEVIAYFLALLELARWGLVTISQEHGSPWIQVRRTVPVDELAVPESEW